jgi:hypothetical protein
VPELPLPQGRIFSRLGRRMVIANEAPARCNGDPAPAWITAVVTTRAKALTSATPGDVVPGPAHVKVFLITMREHFAARNATGPPRAKASAGRYLSLVIDAKTFQGLDFGLGPAAGLTCQPRTGYPLHRPRA